MKVLLDKLTVLQLFNKLPSFYRNTKPHSQEPTTRPYFEPNELSPHSYI